MDETIHALTRQLSEVQHDASEAQYQFNIKNLGRAMAITESLTVRLTHLQQLIGTLQSEILTEEKEVKNES